MQFITEFYRVNIIRIVLNYWLGLQISRTASNNITAAIQNKEIAESTLTVIERPSDKLLSNDKVMMNEQINSADIPRNEIVFLLIVIFTVYFLW